MPQINCSSLLKYLITALAVFLSLFQIYFTGGFGLLDAHVLRAVHLSIVMALIVMITPGYADNDPIRKKNIFKALNIILVILAFSSAYYVFTEQTSLMSRIRYVDDVTPRDMIYGIILIGLVLETTRRTSGWSLVLVSGAFLAYGLWGDKRPGGLAHPGVSAEQLIEQLFLLTDGIYGTPLAVASTMIFAFVMFGAFLHVSGMSSVFMDLACLLTKNSKGGPAKVAIFASALFGTISGSAPANVYGTGTFTFPLMKRVGYSAPFAGAVEAVASTGGQIMPPIMGAAAFIMADLTGAGYLAVAKAALLPAFLYYLALLTMIHFEALSKDLGKLPADQVPDRRQVLKRLYYLLPIALLLAVMFMGRSVIFCAFFATLCVVLLSYFRKETRMTPARLIQGLEWSARNALMISSCCACAGIVVAVIALTGVGYKFISFVTMIAGDNLLLLLICLMITGMILGMGVPTSPAYIIVATLGAPALVKAGVPVIAAHMFVFYYAILSAITPPVCVASFSGAAIAGANAMKTGVISVKLGIVAFVIPFMFVYQPALMLQGEPAALLTACMTSIIGVLGMAGGLQGYFIARCRMWERPLLALGGLALIDSGSLTDLIGIGALAAVSVLQLLRTRRTEKPFAPHL